MTHWYYDQRPSSGIGAFFAKLNWSNLGAAPGQDGSLSLDALGTPQPDDIVFAHGGQWRVFANNNPQVHVVMVSTETSGRRHEQDWPPNLHGCEFPFPPTSDKVTSFLEKLTPNEAPTEVDWTLLIRDAYTEYLVAAYLLQCASKSGKCPGIKLTNLPKGLWENALGEFTEQTKKEGFTDIEPPESLSFNEGMEKVSKLLAKIAEAQAA